MYSALEYYVFLCMCVYCLKLLVNFLNCLANNWKIPQ